MNTEPVGAITDIGVGPALEVRRAQSARIAFAVVLLFASLLAVALDEARHWKPAIDLGLQLDDEDNRIIAVTAGGIAERAGIGPLMPVMRVDDVDLLYQLWRREDFTDTLILSRQGHAYARAGVTRVALRMRPAHPKTRDSLCARRAPPVNGDDRCRTDEVDIVLVIDGPQMLVRDPLVSSPWRVVAVMPLVALLALAAAAIAHRLVRHRDVDRLRSSFIWMAVSATVVVPLWLHVSFLALFADNDEFSTSYQMALFSTVFPWVMLVLIAATTAARAAEGDSTKTSTAPLAIATIIPLLFFIVPGVCVAFVSLLLLHGLRRWQQRVLAREAPAIQADDVVTHG